MYSQAPECNWSLAKKLIFRFFFLYFFFYCFPFPLDGFELTKPIVQPYYDFLDFSMQKMGRYFLHVPVHVAYPGFDKVDDSYYGEAFLITIVMLSAIGTIFWTVMDRQRKQYKKLNAWAYLYLRYFLAAYLLGYGFIKFFPSQFQAVSASRLVMDVGEQTPMLLAWNFMGYSVVFNVVSGSLEIIAGLLLFFRRTATMGAILATFIFSFVALMDFCFNVPIKLLIAHLLLISLVLLLHDSQRLFRLLFLNGAITPRVYPSLFNNQKWERRFGIFLLLFAGCILYKGVSDSLSAATEFGRYAPPVPLYGIYKTGVFIRNGDTVPPLQTDSLRWKQLVIDGGAWKQSGMIELNTDQKIFYAIKADTAKQILKMQSLTDTATMYTFHVERPSPDHLFIEGQWRKDSIRVYFTRYDLKNFKLNSDRFRIADD
jgi:uncharacterized membrane protein YphA (DoxX/SURF4 family)